MVRLKKKVFISGQEGMVGSAVFNLLKKIRNIMFYHVEGKI